MILLIIDRDTRGYANRHRKGRGDGPGGSDSLPVATMTTPRAGTPTPKAESPTPRTPAPRSLQPTSRSIPQNSASRPARRSPCALRMTSSTVSSIDDPEVDAEAEGGEEATVEAPEEPGTDDFHCRYHPEQMMAHRRIARHDPEVPVSRRRGGGGGGGGPRDDATEPRAGQVGSLVGGLGFCGWGRYPIAYRSRGGVGACSW